MSHYSALLEGFVFKQNQMKLRVLVQGQDVNESDIIGGMLVWDDPKEILEIPMGLTKKTTARGVEVIMKLTCREETPFRPLRWSCRIRMKTAGGEVDLKVICSKRSLIRKLRIRNIQCEHRDNMILVPYIGGGQVFKFTWRKRNEYDTAAVRRKEFLAYVLYAVLGPFLRRKNIFIVYEKFCRGAQDNGFYFFRYCMEDAGIRERKRFYYVIDKRFPDYENVKAYEPQVIQFMSLKHMLYAMAAKRCISTDSAEHLYVWQPRPGMIVHRITRKKVLFLQHGVLGLKRVEHLYGANGLHPVEYFVVSSKFEQDIVVRDYGYPRESVPITGLARWDVLEDRQSPENRFVLIMPTWRAWLEDVSDEEFIKSDYYREYIAFLRDPKLDEVLKAHDLEAVLYMHPKFAGYMKNFGNGLSGRIRCVPFGEESLNDLIMRCSMLITDYSSVCWDVLYLNKPVIFYQFDYERYIEIHGSYIDMRSELPGHRSERHEDVIRSLGELAEQKFRIPEEYAAAAGRFFASRDAENSKRIYNYLIKSS